MKIRLIFCACALMLSASLCGCGSEDSSSGINTDTADSADSAESTAEKKNYDLKALSETVAKADQELTKTVLFSDKLFEKNCKNLYDCEYSELRDGVILYNSGGGKANEISVICRNDGDTVTALNALKKRAEQRARDFDNYVPEELPKIQTAKIFAVGDCAVMIISDEASSIEAAVRELLA